MNNLVKRLFKSLLIFTMAVPVFVSCYDDEALWDKLTELEMRVDSLQLSLNEQASALSDLMVSGATISSCTKNADGSYTIELSNGTDFTVLPAGTKFSSLVSYVEQDGKKSWATYDAEGNLIPLTGVGKPGKIEVKLVDDVYYVVVDGTEYQTGFTIDDNVQIFSSCTPLTDDSGQVYAVKLTVGDGWEVTMAIDGYKGVLFKLSAISNTVVTEYYVDFGESQTFLMDNKGVVDYVMQIPDGWRVKETEDKLSGEVYMTVTAPSKETVAMNAAVASGDLKVVSVVEGGKAAVTKLELSTSPYKTYDVTALKAVIEPYNGIQKFFYGITTDYNVTNLMSQISAHLESSADLPKEIFLSEEPINKAHSEICPEISEGQNYTFWSVPVLYTEGKDGQQAGFYVKEEMFQVFDLTPMSVTLTVSNEKLLDADLSVKVLGVNQMYAGVHPMSETALDEIVASVNNGVYDIITDKALMSYNGSVTLFPSAQSPALLDPETEYVVWVLPVSSGKTEFVASDIVFKEFKTKAVAAGGALAPTLGEATVTASSITQKVTCDNASMIYYAYIEGSVGERVSKYSNESMYDAIINDPTFAEVRGSVAEVVIDDLMPETTMWIFAVPVGADGLYGKVAFASAATTAVQFNSLSVSLEKVLVESDQATYKVNVSGGTATDYIYWVGRKTDSFWVETCGSNKTTAAKFMAANPDHELITKAMKTSGPVASDGTLVVTELAIAKEHVLLVLAKDETGNYSKAGYAAFETLSISLGDNYAEEGSAKWNEMKALIEKNIVWDEPYFQASAGQGQGFAAYAFDITVPTDMTAYITCFSTKAAANFGTKLDIMVEIEQSCLSSTIRSPEVIDPATGERALLPDWVDDNGRLIQGTLVNVDIPYPHGDPNAGLVTYFAAGAHNENHCNTWKNGKCSNYEAQMEKIRQLTSFDYWVEYFWDFGNYNYQGDPDSPYSRKLQDEEKLKEIAKAYQDTYLQYYDGIEPVVYVNDGSPLRIVNREAMGYADDGTVADVVTVMLKTLDGSYYDPMYIQVPDLS
ncbi:MAG: hypothetical protein J6Q12_09070 [Bacteroidales bacterium]|nr:hypothetical protein [Bacteroidales bacterium]